MICLKETQELMMSKDYRERFIAEYWQNKIRYEKLKSFNIKIEAAQLCPEDIREPIYDCPNDLLKEQQRIMGEYLHILELRAYIEEIDLFKKEQGEGEKTNEYK